VDVVGLFQDYPSDGANNYPTRCSVEKGFR